MMNKNYCNTYINNFPKTPKNDPKRPHVLPRTPSYSATAVQERDPGLVSSSAFPRGHHQLWGSGRVTSPQAYSIRPLPEELQLER